MNEGESQLQAWIDPEIGASIVALVLGEASDFEAEKLERLIAEKPELAAYRERIESMGGLLGEIGSGGPRFEEAGWISNWRLPDDRRGEVMATFGDRSATRSDQAEKPGSPLTDSDKVEVIPASPAKTGRLQAPWRRLIRLAAVLCVLGILGSVLVSKYGRSTREGRVFMMADNSTSMGATSDIPEEEFLRTDLEATTERLSLMDEADLNGASQSSDGGDESADSPTDLQSLGRNVDLYAAVTNPSGEDNAKPADSLKSSAASSLSKLHETMSSYQASPDAPGERNQGEDQEMPALRTSDPLEPTGGGGAAIISGVELNFPEIDGGNNEPLSQPSARNSYFLSDMETSDMIAGEVVVGNETLEGPESAKLSREYDTKRELETRRPKEKADSGVVAHDDAKTFGRKPAPLDFITNFGTPAKAPPDENLVPRFESDRGQIVNREKADNANFSRQADRGEENDKALEDRKKLLPELAAETEALASPTLQEEIREVEMAYRMDATDLPAQLKEIEDLAQISGPVGGNGNLPGSAGGENKSASAAETTAEKKALGDVRENGQPSPAAIKPPVTVSPAGSGARVDWEDFTVSAGEITKFIEPGPDAVPTNRVIAGAPAAVGEPVQPSRRTIELFDGRETPENAGTEVAAEAIAQQSDEASFRSLATGNGEIDTHLRTSGGGKIDQMAGWRGAEANLSNDGYDDASGNEVSGEIAEGQDFDVTGEIFQFQGTTDPKFWKKSRTSNEAVRRFREGFGNPSEPVNSVTRTDPAEASPLTYAGTNPVTAGLRSGANAIDGDSIDGLISDSAGETEVGQAPGIHGIAGVFTDPQFGRVWSENNEQKGREVSVGSRFGDTVTNGASLRMIVPETGEPGYLGFRDRGKAFTANRVAPPAGLDEKNAAEESFSTFSLHVSDVSFKLALSTLAKGEWPEAGKVRIEEFVNAFDYGDPNPSQDDKVACRVEQAVHPFLQQRNLMRVAMRTAAAGRAGDTPLRLTFLLDNSGSMERADREETVRRAFALLADQLQPIDQVTLISFARQPRLLADKVTGDQSKSLVEVVSNLPSEGGTNLEAALKLAFEKAQEQKTDKAQNRIVLLTDGAANLGNARPESLSAMIESMREEGIAFDAAGIGADGLNDEILEALTRKGDGRYYLLDRPEDADAGFAKQIAGALRPAAKNVKVQVEFNPERVGHYKLLGFEKHLLKKEDFRDDSVDAAEMAAEEAGVAVYQFEARPDGKGDVGFVSVRFRDMSSGEMVEKRWPIPYEPGAPRPDQAAPSMQVATAAALLAAKLNGEPLGETVELGELSQMVSSLPEPYRSKERVGQLQQMIQQARDLAAP